jgi:hypothetical protein
LRGPGGFRCGGQRRPPASGRSHGPDYMHVRTLIANAINVLATILLID